MLRFATRLRWSACERARPLGAQRHAEDIDRELRAACRIEASARLALGTYAGLLLRRRSYRHLGFARLGDYARERLGLSARALEEAAYVATRLAGLARIGAAFRAGMLSWTQVRLLVGVATPATEAAWLRVAGTRPIDGLRATIAAHRPPGRAADPDDDDLIDGERVALVRIECPSRIRSLWRRACELASRMAGEPLPSWRAAEAIAAEGIAARPLGTTIAARMTAALLRVTRLGSSGGRTGTEATVAPLESDGETTTDPAADTDTTDPRVIDARLLATLQTLRTVEPTIGRLLRTLVEQRLHRALGFASLDAYVGERLGLSTRKVWALVRIERGVRRAAPFATAYDTGRLSWARTLALLPVVDPTTADAWLTRANAVTVRRLYDEVNFVLDRRDLEGHLSSLLPPPIGDALDVQIGARRSAASAVTKNGTEDAAPVEVADAEVRFTGPRSVAVLMHAALGVFATPGAPRWRALERLLTRVIADWEAEPRHRDRVFERDGWRCTVPACSSRRNLHDHHVRFRSRGGGNEPSNRTTVCAAHHLHGIHAGLVRVSGEAPNGLRWDLPLFSCIGDRYV